MAQTVNQDLLRLVFFAFKLPYFEMILGSQESQESPWASTWQHPTGLRVPLA